jgi:phenylalanyl-tRNA synthetase alpha chain
MNQEQSQGGGELLKLPQSTQYQSHSELETLLTEERALLLKALAVPEAALTDSFVEDIRIRFNGKKSPLQDFLKSLRVLPPEDRKNAGGKINELKLFIESTLTAFLGAYQTAKEERDLQAEREDLTLPLPTLERGSRHPIAAVSNLLCESFRRMGYSVIDGPELEMEYYNFELLNIPAEHSAREMQDTFFLASEWVLRTQTSNVQAHAMLERKVPLKVVCPGYVYRPEHDVTHVPCFRQFECLVIDKGIHLGHLRHTLDSFFQEVFGRPVKTRWRSSYFPFVEPGAEIDVQCQQCFGDGCRSCKGTGWLEMGGCGLVHRDVLRKCGVDPDVYSGFAFGMGIDRLAMNKFAVSDLRALYEGDVPFLKDFGL